MMAVTTLIQNLPNLSINLILLLPANQPSSPYTTYYVQSTVHYTFSSTEHITFDSVRLSTVNPFRVRSIIFDFDLKPILFSKESGEAKTEKPIRHCVEE